ncbi:MAG: phage baseplate assembly protein V [bacterium]
MDNEKQEYNSIYRGFVVNNRDPEKLGRIMVWIPDLMPNVPQDKGIWAKSANNPVGGRNDEFDKSHNYMGTSYIPGKGSYVWIFFECGNINRPYYFASLEPGNTKVLPESQVGDKYENKWVVFKSTEGRCIVISDDPEDRRVEITGKKRNIKNPPTGDTDSVYEIDGNQTTILFDERDGKEKILIRTHKGDFLHIDIDEQKLQSKFESDISFKTNAKFSLSAESIHLKSNSGANFEAGGELNCKAGGNSNYQSGGDTNILAGGNLNTDGANQNAQQGMAGPAGTSSPNDPEGERDT